MGMDFGAEDAHSPDAVAQIAEFRHGAVRFE
jgi:hypothetical protein